NEILNHILAKGNTKVILAVGAAAQDAIAAEGLNIGQIPVIKLDYPQVATHERQWQSAMQEVRRLRVDWDQGARASFSYRDWFTQLPRIDMPFHMRWWMGTGGDRALRATDND